MKKKPGKEERRERRIIHLLTKEETRNDRKEKELTRQHRLGSMSKTKRGWDSRTRKRWKKIHMKNKKGKDGAKNEYENIIWNRERKGIKKIKNKLKFVTMNIQGINTLGKRQEIEKWMKKKRSIYYAYKRQK